MDPWLTPAHDDLGAGTISLVAVQSGQAVSAGSIAKADDSPRTGPRQALG
jgi:hypothetical protein